MAVTERQRGLDLEPGTSLGKYEVLRKLATGGMAEIYLARVRGTAGFEKMTVIKRILPHIAQDPQFVQMFLDEARLAATLQHPNIADVYDVGEHDRGEVFYAMEYVHGQDVRGLRWAARKRDEQIPLAISLAIIHGTASALDYAHDKRGPDGQPLGLVHRDISSSNIMISYDGAVKLLDFGIARAATGLSNYKEGMLMGKLGYVAPEQASIEHRWDHRVDLFAAGIVLYELLTKQKPFPRATDVDSLVTSRKARVVPPTAIDPRLPKDLDAILSKALAYDPENRFSDARSFADALVDALFPTAISSVQDLLGTQMKAVFAEKISRQRTARAHDPLIMKVLANLAERQVEGEYERFSAPAGTSQPVALGGDGPQPVFESHVAQLQSELPTTEPSRPGARRGARPRTVVRDGVRVSTAILIGLVVAVAGAAGLYLGAETWIRPGVLVVTSEPAGAEVTLDGTAVGKTPAVVEGVWLSRPHELVVEAHGAKQYTMALEPEPGKIVRRVHATLQSSMGWLTIESVPPGAEVRLDGRVVGTTPVTVSKVKVDAPHRLDLTLPGYEVDQLVVLPERDGSKVVRRLARASQRSPASAGE